MRARLIAALCAAVLTAAASGCTGSDSSAPDTRTDSSGADTSLADASSAAEAPSETEPPESTGESLFEADSVTDASEAEPEIVIDPVDAIALTLPEEELENKELRLLTVTAPLREADGQPIPSQRLFEKKYGGKLTVDTVPKDELYGRLAAMVMSNESPDLAPTDELDLFPRGAAAKLFVPLDVVIDTTDELWSSTEELSAFFTYRGQRYAAVLELLPEYVCVYNKSTVRENGLTDPAGLYQQDLWTHGWFETLCREFTDAGQGRTAIDGEVFAEALSESSGVPLLTMSGGQVVSNLDDPRLEETQDWMSGLSEQGFTSLQPQWGISSGTTLFCPADLSLIAQSRQQTELFGSADEVMFLPMPGDGGSYMSAKPKGFFFCAGSKNPKGAVAYLRCLTAANEADKDAEEHRLMGSCGWTEDMIVMRRECFRLAGEAPVLDCSKGMPAETYDKLLKGVLARSMSEGSAVSWADTAEQLRTQLDFAVMTANDTEPTGP